MAENRESIGALWIKKTTSGAEFLSGSIKAAGIDSKIVVFKNSYKKDNQPDYRIYESIQRPNEPPVQQVLPF